MRRVRLRAVERVSGAIAISAIGTGFGMFTFSLADAYSSCIARFGDATRCSEGTVVSGLGGIALVVSGSMIILGIILRRRGIGARSPT